MMRAYDFNATSLREINKELQSSEAHGENSVWEIFNPRGSHAVAVGLKNKIVVKIHGSTG